MNVFLDRRGKRKRGCEDVECYGIQILLTFNVACLLAFLKRAALKNRSKSFKHAENREGNAFLNVDSVCYACRAGYTTDTNCTVTHPSHYRDKQNHK